SRIEVFLCLLDLGDVLVLFWENDLGNWRQRDAGSSSRLRLSEDGKVLRHLLHPIFITGEQRLDVGCACFVVEHYAPLHVDQVDIWVAPVLAVYQRNVESGKAGFIAEVSNEATPEGNGRVAFRA